METGTNIDAERFMHSVVFLLYSRKNKKNRFVHATRNVSHHTYLVLAGYTVDRMQVWSDTFLVA